MERLAAPIGIAALAVGAIVTCLFALSRGDARAEASAGRSAPGEAAADEGRTSATLDVIDDAASGVRETVTETPGDAAAQPDAATPEEFTTVSGLLVLPPGFEPTEPVKVHAWPSGDDDREPSEIELEASATAWTFDQLAPGPWTFTARAIADDHCAWGRSASVQTAAWSERKGVEVVMKEYGVRGIVRDAGGAPVAGLDVHYRLSLSDPMVGEIDGWSRHRRPVSASLDANTWRISVDLEGELLETRRELAALERSVQVLADRDPVVFELPDAETEVRASAGEAQAALLRAWSERLREEARVESAESPFRSVEVLSHGEWAVLGGAVDELATGPSTPPSGAVTTAGDGSFWIPLPGSGEVTLSVRSTRIGPDSTDPGFLATSAETELTEAAPVATHPITVERAAAISGRLSRADGNLDEISVFLRSLDEGDTDVTNTDAEGRFSFSGQRPGKFILYARGGGTSGQSFCTDADLWLTGGSIHRFDDVLTASSSLTGVVVDGAGEPVVGATVVAFGADNRSLKRSARTDDRGVFTIVGMYSVDYTLEVADQELAGGARFRVLAGGAMANAGTLTVDLARTPER